MKKFLLHIILFFLPVILLAQDPIYTLSYEHKTFLNPSLIGRDGAGKLRTALVHRNLFRPLYGPIHNTSAAFDYSFCNSIFALGFNASNETQGNNFYMTNLVSGILGVRRNLSNHWTANAGLSFGLIQQNVDMNEFVFSDQLHPIFGAIYQSSNDQMTINSKLSPDIGFGFDFTNYNQGKSGSRNALNIGFAFQHITNNTSIGLFNDYVLPRRYTGHFCWIHRKNPNTIAQSFQVSGRYDRQLFSNHVLVRGDYAFKDELSLGLGMRSSVSGNTNLIAPLFHCALSLNEQINFHISYEASIGGSKFSNAGNTFEIGIIMRTKDTYCLMNGGIMKGNGRGRMICPVFNKTKAAPSF
jgi:hypothetical protein